jgi:hypothetical protein
MQYTKKGSNDHKKYIIGIKHIGKANGHKMIITNAHIKAINYFPSKMYHNWWFGLNINHLATLL